MEAEEKILGVEEMLHANQAYWITTSHENKRDYIYEGINDARSQVLFREGAIIDSMRRIYVEMQNLIIDGKNIMIKDGSYVVDGVFKDENLFEYSRLEKIWRSKNVK